MIVKLAYEGWHYFEGEQIEVVYGQACDDYIDGAIVLMDINMLGEKANTGVNVIRVTNGSSVKTILIPYMNKKYEGYLLNNEGKTIDKIN